ncbi:MAG: 3-phosphoshikimate 1-carboxyvinyltransferase [Firmicutes bacterium]|nr:3-phosphoshikimate 1-carboxyvinyltransferase [Bacillota bacterium]
MKILVKPATHLEGEVAAPPSKNYTTRYLWLSALTEGESRVLNPANNDDARALLAACRALGAVIREEAAGEDEKDRVLVVEGFGAKPRPVKELDPGNGGLVLRLLLALGLFLPEVTYVNSYPDSLGKRPQDDLLTALRALGAEVTDRGGRLPITVRGGHPLARREITVSGKVSSQYATALLFVAPLLGGLTIRISHGLSSPPPLATTLQVMTEGGVMPLADWERLVFTVPAGRYRPGLYRVPGDYPAAAALAAAAAVLPSRVTLANLAADDRQGEKAALTHLAKMGAKLHRAGRGVEIRGGLPLRAVDFYGADAIDAVLAMAAAAALAEGTSRFYGVGNLRWKESDRIGDFARELRKTGVEVREGQDEFWITGNPGGYLGGVEIDAHQDHRLVMAFSILALRTREGLVIDGAEHVKKSYPAFFTDLASLGAVVEELD